MSIGALPGKLLPYGPYSGSTYPDPNRPWTNHFNGRIARAVLLLLLATAPLPLIGWHHLADASLWLPRTHCALSLAATSRCCTTRTWRRMRW